MEDKYWDHEKNCPSYNYGYNAKEESKHDKEKREHLDKLKQFDMPTDSYSKSIAATLKGIGF